MGLNSKISWTQDPDGALGATWNPLVGCSKVSAGCDRCYAETLVNRFAGHNKAFPNRFDVVTMRGDSHMLLPLSSTWQRQPLRIFVNSLSDLFHDDVPVEFIARVFAVMATCPQHTFQMLTKRPGRMRSVLRSDLFRALYAYQLGALFADRMIRKKITIDQAPKPELWPLPNVWLGVSVEDQRWAGVRIPLLLDTPAAVRWLSCEPLLAPVSLREWLPVRRAQLGQDGPGVVPLDNEQAIESAQHGLDITNARNLPGADGFPSVPLGSGVIPAHPAAVHRGGKPVDEFGRGAVDRHDGRALATRVSAPLDVALSVEKPGDVAEGGRIGRHPNAARPQSLSLPSDDPGRHDPPPHGLAGDAEPLGDLHDAESGGVRRDDVRAGRSGVDHKRQPTFPPTLDWIVCGGESGTGARRMDPAWARSLRDECAVAGVPFFMKQLGGALAREMGVPGKGHRLEDLPPDLQVQQFPQPVAAA